MIQLFQENPWRKGFYRVDGPFSSVSHQFKLINFVDFSFFFAPVVSVSVGP